MVWRPNIASKADNPTLGEIKEFARQETFFCFLLLAIIIIYENEHGGNLDIFLIKIILAFVIGAVWITLATVIAEKFGTKIGGMVLGLPSTTAISLFFIAWTQSPSVAAEATTIIPIIMGINTLFILGYVFVSKFNFPLSIIIAIAAWFIPSFFLLWMNFNDLAYSIAGCAIFLIGFYYIMEKKLKITSKEKKSIEYTIPQLGFRALLSGGIITTAVLMAKIGGPMVGGVFTTFPAAFLSTIIITHLKYGREFAAAMMKMSMISAATTIVIYAMIIRYSYLHFEIITGTVIALVITFFAGFIIYKIISKKIK